LGNTNEKRGVEHKSKRVFGRGWIPLICAQTRKVGEMKSITHKEVDKTQNIMGG